MAANPKDRACQGEKREQFPQSTAKKASTGFDCEFVIQPQAEFQANCPICLLVLREPHQVSCCGKSFCQMCIERVERQKGLCPTCNQQGFTVHANKGLKQSLCAFCVYCSHQNEGCKWTGELGALEKHLNKNPQLHEQLIGCEFTEIECHHCFNLFQRRYVTAHQIEECIRRPFSCDYCGNYGADFEDVTTKHWPVCGSYPVPCPNECGVYPERQNLEHHVSKDCTLTVVNCDFHYAGCEVQLSRKDMPAHLAENMALHMARLATHNERIVKERDNQITKLGAELTSHKHKLSEEIARKDDRIAELEDRVAHATERKSHELRMQFTHELREQLQQTQEKMTRQYQLEMVRVREDAQRGRVYLWITVIALLVAMGSMSKYLKQEFEEVASKAQLQLHNLKQSDAAIPGLKQEIIDSNNEQGTVLKREIEVLRKEQQMASEAQLRQEVDKLKQSIATIQGEMEQEINLLKTKQEGAMPKTEGAALQQVVEQLRQSSATKEETEELKKKVDLLRQRYEEDMSRLESGSAAVMLNVDKLQQSTVAATQKTAELKEKINLLSSATRKENTELKALLDMKLNIPELDLQDVLRKLGLR